MKNKVLAFTYSTISFKDPDIDNLIVKIRMSSFKSEENIRKELINFFRAEGKKLYLIELDLAREGHHILYIKSVY